jgi:hypothetical protein
MAGRRVVVAVVVLWWMGWGLEMGAAQLGVNWGTISSDPLSNSIVVQMLKDNNFAKVKLFDANSDVIESMRGTNLEVMVGITNDMLAALAGSVDAATAWVQQNVTAHLGNNGVNIAYAPSLPFAHFLSTVSATVPELRDYACGQVCGSGQ